MLFAERQLQLDKPQGDDRPLRAHLEAVKKQTGITPELLKPINCPPELLRIWYDFIDIRNGIYGDRIAYVDIEAWARINRIEITPLEAQLIKRIDRMFLNG